MGSLLNWKQMVEGGVQSRFHRDDTPLGLPEMRAKWDTVFRKEADLLLEESKGEVSKEEISISVRDGSTVRALVYRRTCSPAEKGPLFIILHGGGFRIGNAEMEARACIGATQTYGCVSVSLEYRLSPENKFPVAYDDAWDALLWVRDCSKGGGVEFFMLTKKNSYPETTLLWVRMSPRDLYSEAHRPELI
jgi:acetyl esterase/lipase